MIRLRAASGGSYPNAVMFGIRCQRGLGVWLLAGAAALVSGVPAHGYNVYGLGAEQPNPWSAAVSSEPGDYIAAGPDGLGSRRVAVGTQTSYPTWRETLAVSVDSTGGSWLRPFFLPDTLNLARDGVRDRIKHGILHNIAISGCNNIASAVVVVRPIFDGDPKTASLFRASATEDPAQRAQFYVQNTIVNLGADFPINRVRFFPRLGRENPKLEEILDGMGEPRLRPEDLGEQDFSLNTLPWYEVSVAPRSAGFAGSCFWRSSTRPWFRRIAWSNPQPDPQLTLIRRELENFDVVVDIRFPSRPLQWIAFRPVDPIANWEMAEFQVFGEGFVPRAVYTTAVLDFGEPMAWGRIRWRGEHDPEARISLRTRSGSDSDPDRYWIPGVIPGVDDELTREEFDRADINNRFTTLDENWSYWSAPYAWETGLRDTTVSAEAWLDGTPIRSPGPARYLQLQMIFESTLSDAARLQDLEIQFGRPSAARVVAEIWPLDVPRTEATTFTYSVLPTLEDGQGFDRLEVFTLTRVDTVRAVRVDGAAIDISGAVQIADDRFLVSLPPLRDARDSFKLIEVEFDSQVVRYGTRFDGWIFDSEGAGVRQQVIEGDATVDYPGNILGVRTSDLGASPLAVVRAWPNPFSPNGDGINDVAHLQFRVHELTVPRRLTVDIHDLSGRLVRRLEERHVRRGLSGRSIPAPEWDGRDDGGRMVPPGLYIFRIHLETDASTRDHSGAIAVAY